MANVNAEWGAACRLKLDPTAFCQTTQLTTTADPVVSCGASGLLVNGTNQVHAIAVPGANRYQFRFTRPGYTRNIAVNGRSLTLAEWNTNPLQLGQCYDVVVRVSFDNGATWCAYGTSCQICTAPAPPVDGANDRMLVEAPAAPLSIWPNPNTGEQLTLHIEDLGAEHATVAMDLTDLYGKRVASRMLPVNGTSLNAAVDLDGLASGLYMVTITAGDRIYTERLVVR